MSAHRHPLTLTIVIPAYNEEHHIAACLDAIGRLSEPADEVIVVNNNSTDNTEKVARRYKFVKVVREPVQGLIAARNCGFKEASGDILGRIDADAQVAHDWVTTVKQSFANESIAAISGTGRTDTLPHYSGFKTTFWSKVYLLWSSTIFDVPILWGANMAIRRSAWDQIKNETCKDDSVVHEDQDVSMLLAGHNLRVDNRNAMTITTDGETYYYWPKFREYVGRAFSTRRHHKMRHTLGNNPATRLVPARRIAYGLVTILPAVLFVTGSLLDYYVRVVLGTLKTKKRYQR